MWDDVTQIIRQFRSHDESRYSFSTVQSLRLDASPINKFKTILTELQQG